MAEVDAIYRVSHTIALVLAWVRARPPARAVPRPMVASGPGGGYVAAGVGARARRGREEGPARAPRADRGAQGRRCAGGADRRRAGSREPPGSAPGAVAARRGGQDPTVSGRPRGPLGIADTTK